MTSPDTLDERKAGRLAGRRSWPRRRRSTSNTGTGSSIFDDGGDRVVGHTGGISGYTACMQMNLTRGFGVIAFANLVEAPLHPCAIVLYAMRVLRAQSLGQPIPAPPPAPDPAHVERAERLRGNVHVRRAARCCRSSLRATASRLIDGGKRIALYPRGRRSLLGRRSQVRDVPARVRARPKTAASSR